MEDKQIPSLEMNETGVVLPTREVPIIFNGQEEVVVLQKLSSGVRREIMKRHVKTSIVGQQAQGSVDAIGLQAEILYSAIIKAPFKVDKQTIDSLPDNIVDYLYGEYSEFADDVKKN